MNTNLWSPHLQLQQTLSNLYIKSPALSGLDSLCQTSKMAIAWPNYDLVNRISETSKITNSIKAYNLSYPEMPSSLLLTNKLYQSPKILFSAPTFVWDTIKSPIHTTVLDIQSALDRITGPSLRVQERLIAAIGPSLEIQQKIGTVFRNHGWIENFIKLNQLLPKVDNYFSKLSSDDIKLDSNGILTIDDHSVALDKINESLSKLADNVYPEEDAGSFWVHLFNGIDKLPAGLKRIIEGVIIGLIVLFIGAYCQSKTLTNKQDDIRKIKKETINQYSAKELSYFRFVTIDILIVRKGPSQNTKKLDELYFGQAVHVIQKKKNWTLVGYENYETDDILLGWVFTCHIKKFKK